MRFNQVEFGRRLKALRKARGMTQEELAAALSITPNHLGKIEMGIEIRKSQIVLKSIYIRAWEGLSVHHERVYCIMKNCCIGVLAHV